MDFAWSDYMVIQDGVMDNFVEKKKMISADTLSTTFLAWRQGMFPDTDFRDAIGELGLYDQKYIKGPTNQVSDKDMDKIIDDSGDIISKTFPEE